VEIAHIVENIRLESQFDRILPTKLTDQKRFEFCSSPCPFRSRPAAIPKMPLRYLTNAA
jgi:hypothetical protein